MNKHKENTIRVNNCISYTIKYWEYSYVLNFFFLSSMFFTSCTELFMSNEEKAHAKSERLSEQVRESINEYNNKNHIENHTWDFMISYSTDSLGSLSKEELFKVYKGFIEKRKLERQEREAEEYKKDPYYGMKFLEQELCKECVETGRTVFDCRMYVQDYTLYKYSLYQRYTATEQGIIYFLNYIKERETMIQVNKSELSKLRRELRKR